MRLLLLLLLSTTVALAGKHNRRGKREVTFDAAATPEGTVAKSVGDTNVQLKCTAKSTTGDIDYAWAKNGVELKASDQYKIAGDSLTFAKPLVAEDAAEYTCTATDDEDEKVRKFKLVVNAKAPPATAALEFVEGAASESTLVAGQDLSLKCTPKDKEAKVTAWTFNGGALPADATMSADKQTLTIAKAKEADKGKYVCTAGKGGQTSSRTIVVASKAAPAPPAPPGGPAPPKPAPGGSSPAPGGGPKSMSDADVDPTMEDEELSEEELQQLVDNAVKDVKIAKDLVKEDKARGKMDVPLGIYSAETMTKAQAAEVLAVKAKAIYATMMKKLESARKKRETEVDANSPYYSLSYGFTVEL